MAHTENHGTGPARGPADGTDINIPAVLGFLVFLAISFLLTNLALYGMYRGLDVYDEKQQTMNQHQESGVAESKSLGITQAESNSRIIQRIQNTYSLKDGPRLQVDDVRDLDEMHRSEEPKLNGYHWVNQSQNVVQIPVGQAMEILVKRGLPNVPATKPATAAPAAATPVKAK